MSDERRSNLRELTLRYRDIGEAIADLGGDLENPEVCLALEQLDAIEGSIHLKIDAYRAVMDRMTDQAEARRREGNLRIKRAQALEKAVSILEQRAIESIEATGLKRAGSVIPLAVYNNGGKPSIEWTRIGEPIPDGFRRHKITIELDKDEVYRRVQSFQPIPEGIKVTRGKHLRPVVGESRSRAKGGESAESK